MILLINGRGEIKLDYSYGHKDQAGCEILVRKNRTRQDKNGSDQTRKRIRPSKNKRNSNLTFEKQPGSDIW